MNVLIRRLGITIKTIPIKGDKARVGSGEDCEICLSDPYLAPVVAELVRRDGEWYIVDLGSSLDGVRRGDEKIAEEILEPGEAYLVGGFEIVREGTAGARRTLSRATTADSIPRTMFQAKIEPLPGTVVQSLDEIRAEIRASKPPLVEEPKPKFVEESKSKLAFRRLATAEAIAHPERPVKAPRSRIRLILLTAALLFGFLILAVVIGSDSGKPAPPSKPAQVEAAVVKTEAAPARPSVRGGDQAAMVLDLENAFAGWEAELKRQDTPALRQKIVTGALEIGRAYAAIGDPRARDYLERVVRVGEPGSVEVVAARERLDLIRK